MWHLWIWERVSWRVLGTYETYNEAARGLRHGTNDEKTLVVAKDGGVRDLRLRRFPGMRYAYRDGRLGKGVQS